jgi:REP element-mobilizing transposase RayT
MRICAYAVMPNHWHVLVWRECDSELAKFMQRLTITHDRDGNSTGAIRDWARFTRDGTNRFR